MREQGVEDAEGSEGFAVWRVVAPAGSMSAIRRYVSISPTVLMVTTREEDSAQEAPRRIDQARTPSVEWVQRR